MSEEGEIFIHFFIIHSNEQRGREGGGEIPVGVRVSPSPPTSAESRAFVV